MSVLFDHLSALFDRGHGLELPDLRDDAHLGPRGTPRPAAVLIAVTEREEPGVLLIHRPEDMRAHPGRSRFPAARSTRARTLSRLPCGKRTRNWASGPATSG